MILLSENCAPLYNFSVLEKTLVNNNKSWFNISNGESYARDFHRQIYDYNSGSFTINDITYSSQWHAIDERHFKFFINFEKNNYVKTYEKDGDTTCNTEKIKAIDINSVNQKYLESVKGSWSSIEDLNTCVTSDETIILAILKHNIGDNKIDLENNLEMDSIINLIERLKNNYITQNDGEIISKNVLHNTIGDIGLENNNHCWFGGNIQYNKNNIKQKLYFFKINNDKFGIYNKNRELKYLNKIQKDELCKSNEGLIGGNYGKSNSESCDVGTKEGIVLDKYGISCTYTDWTKIGMNPDNLFRNFNSKKFTNEEIDLIPNITNALNNDPEKLITDLNSLLGSAKLINPNESFSLNSAWHPLEYTTYNLTSIVNAYNLLIYFNITNLPNNEKYNNSSFNFLEFSKFYYLIIQDNLGILKELTVDGKKYFNS
jgi:hypothetical protein